MNDVHTEFQVAEYYDSALAKVWRVELQYRRVVKDAYGTIHYCGNWETVPRVRLFYPENSIP